MPRSSDDWVLYTCFLALGHYGNLGEKGPNTPKSSTESHKKKFKVFNSLFDIRWDLMLVFRLSVGGIIPVSQVLRYWGNLGNWAWIPQITFRETWKVIQSLQILILHQMRPYSSAKALLWGELYLFHRYSGMRAIWGNLAQITQIMHRDTWIVIQVFRSTFHIKLLLL